MSNGKRTILIAVITTLVGGITPLIAVVEATNSWAALITPVPVFTALIGAANALKAFLDDSTRRNRSSDASPKEPRGS